MADNISTQYSPVYTNRLQTTQAPTLPGANVAAYVPAADSVSLSRASVTATASPDVRQELQALQADLARINKQVESLLARIDGQPGLASVTPLPGVAPASSAGGTYQTQTGDYLWKIAKETLGDANRWPEIYQLNQAAIGENPNLLQPGLALKLPAGALVQPAASNPLQPNIVEQPIWPTQNVQYPPLNGTLPPLNAPLPMANQPALPAAPPVLPPLPTFNAPLPQAPTYNQLPGYNQVPTYNQQPGYNTQAPVGKTDVPAMTASNRQLTDADALRIATSFGLAPAGAAMTPQLKANTALFLDEMDSYEQANKGKVFGPGMEALATSPTEVQQIRASVSQIQQALDILIKAGRLRVTTAQGQSVTQLPATGSFFKLDAQGRELKDAAGNPVMDEAFVAAVTTFKQQQGIHQNYRLADGTFGINEYVGPGTVEALKAALVSVQQGR